MPREICWVETAEQGKVCYSSIYEERRHALLRRIAWNKVVAITNKKLTAKYMPRATLRCELKLLTSLYYIIVKLKSY